MLGVSMRRYIEMGQMVCACRILLHKAPDRDPGGEGGSPRYYSARKVLRRLRPFLAVPKHSQLVQSRPQDLVQVPIQFGEQALAELQNTLFLRTYLLMLPHLLSICAHSLTCTACTLQQNSIPACYAAQYF